MQDVVQSLGRRKSPGAVGDGPGESTAPILCSGVFTGDAQTGGTCLSHMDRKCGQRRSRVICLGGDNVARPWIGSCVPGGPP